MVRKMRTKNLPSAYDELMAPVSVSRVSVGLEDKIKEYYQIDVDQIFPYKKQARKTFNDEDIRNLSETIKLYGVRQPLTVIKGDIPGRYEVVSGERRLRAAKLAGLERVPCILIDDNSNVEEIALIENIQRSDLHPVELASAYESLLRDYKYGDFTSLSTKLGVTKSQVSETLSYNNLPSEIKSHLLEKNIRARSTLRALLKMKDVEEMKKLLGLSSKANQITASRLLFRISLENGKISINRSNAIITEDQKNQLKEMLVNLAEELSQQK